MKLVKAKLIVHNDPSKEAQDIEFMYNPSELDFTRQINWNYDVGNRGATLLPKVNFSGIEPYSFTLQNLLFDTYEQKTCVLGKYIENIKKGATAYSTEGSRPPVYILTWHAKHFYCVMTSLNYRLTLFLPDGTPVKAIVNIGLQEVDPCPVPGGMPPQITASDDFPQPARKPPKGGARNKKRQSKGKPPKSPNQNPQPARKPPKAGAGNNPQPARKPPKAGAGNNPQPARKPPKAGAGNNPQPARKPPKAGANKKFP